MSDVQLIIDYKNGNIKEVSTDAEKKFGKSGEKAGKNFSSRFSDALNTNVGPAIAKIGAAAAALGSLTLFKSIKNAAQLEVINTQFEVMLKSTSAAQKQLADLQDFAASTPFQLPGLAEATKQLLSFGVAQTDVIPTLQQLGDIAAGVGADITDLTIPFGRLISTQKLTLQELDKFADRGVNIYAALADQTGRSLKTIRDDISKGRVPFEEFTRALGGMTAQGGIFFQGMEKQSKTLNGVLSTLGDNFFNMTAAIGKAFSPLVVQLVTKITEVIQDMTKKVQTSFNVFDDVIDPMMGVTTFMVENLVPAMELVANVGNIAFGAINSAVATVVASLGWLGGAFAGLLDKFGVMNEMSAGLKTFEESSRETALAVNKDFSETIASGLDFPVSDILASKNEQLRTYFQEQRAIIEEEGAITSEVTTAQAEQAAEQTMTYGDLISGTFKGISLGVNKTKEEMANAATQTAKIVKGGLAKGISGGIQNIVNSLAKGEDVFANFGKFILSTIGDLAIQMGQFFIAEGIAVEAMNAVSGTGAIVAGAALVALGTLLKSFSGGGGGSTAGATGGGSGGTTAPSFDTTEPSGEFLEEASAATPNTVVNFNIEGNVKGDEEFIRDTVASIGEEAGKQGLVFDNFATS